MNEIYWFIITTYLLAGLFQGIIVSIYESWNDGCGHPGEYIMFIIFISYMWLILWIFELFEWSHKSQQP